MKVNEFFDLVVEVVKENENQLFTAWKIGRHFEKWLQLEILTKLDGHYEDYFDDFQDSFHSEYRVKDEELDKRGNHEKRYKQVDLYIANGKNDTNQYMYVELKTGFAKYVVPGVIKDYYWLGKIKPTKTDAKERIAALVLLNSEEKNLDDIQKNISSKIQKRPSHQTKFVITKKHPHTNENHTVHVLVALWKLKH